MINWMEVGEETRLIIRQETRTKLQDRLTFFSWKLSLSFINHCKREKSSQKVENNFFDLVAILILANFKMCLAMS